MQRIKYKYQSNLIRDAVGLLPLKVLPFLDTVDFVFDYNPFYLGFNPPDKTDDGRKYIDICHCVFSWSAPDRKRTIFLFNKNLKNYNESLDVIWHEIAHTIHEKLDFIKCEWIPITDYEIQNSKWDWYGFETFACSFVRWLYKDRQLDSWKGNQELQKKYDIRPIEFFNSLFGIA